MKKERIFLSTIDPEAQDLARAYGLGLEIAEFCTAWNMDRDFPQTDVLVRQKLAGISRRVLHGPFNELFPCAIDPKARALAAERFHQAAALAQAYGAERMVLHGGFNPWLYYEPWYVSQSADFWRNFSVPEGLTICVENVMETKPELLLSILEQAENPGLGLCLDVGHVNAYSGQSPMEWVRTCAGWIRHVHIHNNFGDADSHNGLNQGTIPMEALLEELDRLCPQATVTLEVPQARESVLWLKQCRIWEE